MKTTTVATENLTQVYEHFVLTAIILKITTLYTLVYIANTTNIELVCNIWSETSMISNGHLQHHYNLHYMV